MQKLTDTIESIEMNVPYTTEFINVFYNAATKKFRASITVDVTENKAFEKLKELCEKIEPKTPFRMNKENTKQYVKLNVSEELKIFGTEKNELRKVDLEELFKKHAAKLIFTISRYCVSGTTGISFKVHQILVKEKENRFVEFMFDE